jgi:hypothetical protein
MTGQGLNARGSLDVLGAGGSIARPRVSPMADRGRGDLRATPIVPQLTSRPLRGRRTATSPSPSTLVRRDRSCCTTGRRRLRLRGAGDGAIHGGGDAVGVRKLHAHLHRYEVRRDGSPSRRTRLLDGAPFVWADDRRGRVLELSEMAPITGPRRSRSPSSSVGGLGTFSTTCSIGSNASCSFGLGITLDTRRCLLPMFDPPDVRRPFPYLGRPLSSRVTARNVFTRDVLGRPPQSRMFVVLEWLRRRALRMSRLRHPLPSGALLRDGRACF